MRPNIFTPPGIRTIECLDRPDAAASLVRFVTELQKTWAPRTFF
jgi:hypothetical protein